MHLHALVLKYNNVTLTACISGVPSVRFGEFNFAVSTNPAPSPGSRMLSIQLVALIR